MEKIINFLRRRTDITITAIEAALGVPNGTINIRKGVITQKHVKPLESFLKVKYGYDPLEDDLVGNKDNINKHVIVRAMYNEGRIPGFKDKIWRYQTENGLWDKITKHNDKEGNLKKEYHPKDDEVFDDKIGTYYIANNGIKIYTNFK